MMDLERTVIRPKSEGFVEDLRRWMGVSGSQSNQLPFGPLEIGDVLTLRNLRRPFGKIQVTGVPMESNRVFGGVQKEPVQSWPVAPEQRRTGFYSFRDIDAFVRVKKFSAFYTGSSIVCYGSVANYVFGIVSIKHADGTMTRARFKRIRPSWTRIRPKQLLRRAGV